MEGGECNGIMGKKAGESPHSFTVAPLGIYLEGKRAREFFSLTVPTTQ